MGNRPSSTQMLNQLAEHYSVKRGSMNVDQWRQAVKHAAGAPHDAIEVIWDKWKGGPSETAKTEKPSENAHDVASTPGTVTIFPPVQDNPVHSHATQGVGGGHPVSVYVTTSAPAVPPQVLGTNLGWAGVASVFAPWCQTLALGIAIGVLISKPIMKGLGH